MKNSQQMSEGAVLTKQDGEKVASQFDYKKLGFERPTFSVKTSGRSDRTPNKNGVCKVTKSQGCAVANFTMRELNSAFEQTCIFWLFTDSVTLNAYPPFVSFGQFGRVKEQAKRLDDYLDLVLDEFLTVVIPEWGGEIGKQNEYIDLRPIVMPEDAPRKESKTRSGGRTL